jgi:hypothetical protein
VFVAEVQPQLPRIVGFGGAGGNDSGFDRLLDSDEITNEIISFLARHSIQGEG